MINLKTSSLDDVPQIEEWTRHDAYHFCQSSPTWWLTGNGLLAFRLEDGEGPLTYVRLDEEGEYIRLHTQFAPENVVSKKRLVMGLIEGLPKLARFYKGKFKGIVFNSVSPSLIAFMAKQGYKPVGNNDYRLDFEGQ